MEDEPIVTATVEDTCEKSISCQIDLEESDGKPLWNVKHRQRLWGEIIEKSLEGDVFESDIAAKHWYEKYGKIKGFSVVVKSSQRTQRNYDEFTSYLFACHHHGSHDKIVDEDVPIEKRRPNTSTVKGVVKLICGYLSILKHLSGLFEILRMGNHDFVPTPNKMLLKTSQAKLSKGVKCIVELFSKENLPITRVNSILLGDVLSFNDRSCWNYLHDVRQKLDVGNAQCMTMYFQKRQAENPQFYYAIQADVEGRTVNFFGG